MTIKTIINDDPTKFRFDEIKSTLAEKWDEDPEKLFDKIYNNEPISKATLNRYTRSLRRYVKQIYGW